MTFISGFTLLLSLLPTWIQVAIVGCVALMLIILVLKLIALVLDAIPFL